jgi:hypothetical protein
MAVQSRQFLIRAVRYVASECGIRQFMDAVPSGSYLILWDGTTDSQAYVTLCEEYGKAGGVPYTPAPKTKSVLSSTSTRWSIPASCPSPSGEPTTPTSARPGLSPPTAPSPKGPDHGLGAPTMP